MVSPAPQKACLILKLLLLQAATNKPQREIINAKAELLTTENSVGLRQVIPHECLMLDKEVV